MVELHTSKQGIPWDFPRPCKGAQGTSDTDNFASNAGFSSARRKGRMRWVRNVLRQAGRYRIQDMLRNQSFAYGPRLPFVAISMAARPKLTGCLNILPFTKCRHF